MGKKKGFSM